MPGERDECPTWVYQGSPEDSPELKEAAVAYISDSEWDQTLVELVAMELDLVGDGGTSQRNRTIRVEIRPEERTISIPDMRNIAFQDLRSAYIMKRPLTPEENILTLSIRSGDTLNNWFIHEDNGAAMIRRLNTLRKILFQNYRETLSAVDYLVPIFSRLLTVTVGDVTQNFIVELDQECVCMYERPFLETPTHVMYFYKEEGLHVIDKVSLTLATSTVTISVDGLDYDLRGEAPVMHELMAALRRVKPKRTELFQNPADLAAFIAPGQTNSDGADQTLIPSPELHRSEIRTPFIFPESHSHGSQQRVNYDESDESYGYAQQLQSQMKKTEDLFTDPRYEEAQVYWITVEDDIKAIIASGFVPETEVDSAGINPNSLEHLRTCIQDVEAIMRKENFSEAVSRLQGCRKIFLDSSDWNIKAVFQDDDVTFLKKLYFRTWLS